MPLVTIWSAGTAVMSSPAKVIVPATAGVSPQMARSVVDLPAPFDPMSVTTSPSPTVRDTPARASIAP